VIEPVRGDEHVVEGVWPGRLALAASGDGGFGYDPYFLVPAYGRTVAELTPDEKNAVSHRGVALRRLLELLRRDT
jgi:XTP/dITP diphosphohydrolase